MNKYILVAFAFLGVGFYELSGGSDFEPGTNSLVVFAEPKPAAPKEKPALVARADTSEPSLTDIAPTRAPARAVVESAPDESVAGLALVKLTPSESPDLPLETETVAAPAEAEILPEPVVQSEPDLRFVDGDTVNLRGGPGTNFAVVGKLYRNDMVEVLKDEGNGWLHLRDTLTGDEGWMADWLVTAAN